MRSIYKFSEYKKEEKQKQIEGVIPESAFVDSSNLLTLSRSAVGKQGERDNTLQVLQDRNEKQAASKDRIFMPSETNSSSQYFTKTTHNDEWAIYEALFAKFASAFGITAPRISFSKDGIKKLHSKRIRGYHDVANFIEEFVEQNKTVFFKAGDIVKINSYYDKLKKLKSTFKKNRYEEEEQKEEIDSATYKVKRKNIIVKIFNFFPDEIKDKFYEMWALLAWLGHWDTLNWSLENMGLVIRTFRTNGSSYMKISGAIVDGGNSFYCGFGGEYKKNSFGKANKAAKPKNTSRKDDFDPEIPANKKIAQYAANFDKGCIQVLLGAVPRRLPFEDFFTDLDKEIVLNLSDSSKAGKIPRGFIRGLYRIRNITEKMINDIVDNYFYIGKKRSDGIIEIKAKDDSISNADNLKAIIKARREHLLELFGKQIKNFENLFPQEVLAIKAEMCIGKLRVEEQDEKKEIEKEETIQNRINEIKSSIIWGNNEVKAM